MLVENRLAENGSHLLMFDALRIAGGPAAPAIKQRPALHGLPASRSTMPPPQDAAMSRPERVLRAQSQSKLSARAGSPPR